MRNIYTVTAKQVVVSDAHPEGAYSVVPNYPKLFDSRNYGGDLEKTFRIAKSEYLSRVSALLASDTRAMWTVTLERDDGRQIMRESFGAFPEEPTPVEEPEEEPVVTEQEPGEEPKEEESGEEEPVEGE